MGIRFNHSPLEGESQRPSQQAKADAVGGVGGEASGLARSNGLPGQARRRHAGMTDVCPPQQPLPP